MVTLCFYTCYFGGNSNYSNLIPPIPSLQYDCYYFFVRKVLMSFSAEAFIFFPGGFGTLDEFFEMVTLIQTKKIEGVPIICVGGDYWNSVDKFIKDELLSRKAIESVDTDLYTITDSHDEVLEIIKAVSRVSGGGGGG